MSDDVATVSVTEFKAKCLKYFADLEKHRLRKVIVTRRGKVVGEVNPPTAALRPLHGAGRGTIEIAPGVDLTEPVFDIEDFDAWHGKLYHGE
jgi:hypothetical protein